MQSYDTCKLLLVCTPTHPIICIMVRNFACTVISAFFIHTESIPCCRTEDLIFRYIVHNMQEYEAWAHSDQVCTNMSIEIAPWFSTPVVHNVVSRFERASLPSYLKLRTKCMAMYNLYVSKSIRYIPQEALQSIPLRNLKNRSKTLYKVSGGSLFAGMSLPL